MFYYYVWLLLIFEICLFHQTESENQFEIATQCCKIVIVFKNKSSLNPLTPRRTQVSSFTEISILFSERIVKKFPMSVAPMSR